MSRDLNGRLMTKTTDIPGECPKCKADLKYEIYGSVFSKVIGWYDYKVDRTVEWECPECHHRWPRDLANAPSVKKAKRPKRAGGGVEGSAPKGSGAVRGVSKKGKAKQP